MIKIFKHFKGHKKNINKVIANQTESILETNNDVVIYFLKLIEEGVIDLKNLSKKEYFTIEEEANEESVSYKIGNYSDEDERNYSLKEYEFCIEEILKEKDFCIWKYMYLQYLLRNLIIYEIHTTSSFVKRCLKLSYIVM